VKVPMSQITKARDDTGKVRPREASSKRVEKRRQADRERLQRTPARELVRQTRHHLLFGGHASQFFTECSSEDGQPSVRLTPIKLADRSGKKSDSLYHPWQVDRRKALRSAPASRQSTCACTMCGTEFVPKRSDARTCGSACRQRAHRLRVVEARE
jgi:hypothetical protein